MRGKNLKSIGILIGLLMIVCGLALVILMVEQPTSLIEGEEWILVDLLDNGEGLWMDGSGNLKIDSSEGYEVGETYKSETEIDFVIVLLGMIFMIVGLGFVVMHSGIER